MEIPTLLSDGDSIERATWPALKNVFPHYEDFWRLHLYPLRSIGSIYLRKGVDEKFEYLAMFHYSAYVSLGRAYQKINNQTADPLFPDEVYWNLSRAAELALKVIATFSGIYEECLGQRPNLNSAPINRLAERTRSYRNLIHAQIHAVSIDSNKRRQIPRPERLAAYGKWSDTRDSARSEDFVDMDEQLNNDFYALCSALENAWKSMCVLSVALTVNGEYLKRRGAGASVSVRIRGAASVSPSVSGTMMDHSYDSRRRRHSLS